MYSRGEIVLIPVPFSDLSATKRRPVLVISNDAHNGSNSDMLVVAITSNLIQSGIPISTSDMLRGQLPKASLIRTDKLYTLDQGIVVKSIGQVASYVLDKVKTDIIKLVS